MKTYLMILLALSAGFAPVGLRAQVNGVHDGNPVWWSYFGTNQYRFEVSWAVIDKTPIWRERDDQPPLAARKALLLARAELPKFCRDALSTNRDAANWKLISVALTPLAHEGQWIYLVRFDPPALTSNVLVFDPSMNEHITIPVLMSGVAVEPEIKLWKR